MGFLSGAENKSVIVQERQRVGGQLMEFRVFELEGWLGIARRLLLTKEVGHIIGTEGSGRVSFLEGGGDSLRAVIAEQIEEFGDLAGEGAAGVGQPSQVGFHRLCRTDPGEPGDQALLGLRALRRRALSEEFLFEALGAEGLAAPPGARVTDDFAVLVIKGDPGSIGFDDQELADQMRRHAVTVAVELDSQVLIDEGLDRIAVVRREGR
jgi:hypothetical protein